MKILHILNDLQPSGAEVMVSIAAPVWMSMGFELHVLSTGIEVGPFAGALANAGITIHHLPEKRGMRLPGWMLDFSEMLRTIAPDVVHLHAEGLCLPKVVATRIAGFPMLRTVHNNFLFRGRLRLKKAFERSVCRLLGCRFIAISPSVMTNERSRFRNPSTLCHNWFDEKVFRPPTCRERVEARESLGVTAEQMVIVSVGNGSRVKNFSAIIQSIAILRNATKTFQSSRELLYFSVGNTHPEHMDERIAAELDLQAQVRFVGPQSDVRRFLWAADIYAMPSLYEGFGLAAVEALGCGVPCIFADTPGLADFKAAGLQIVYVSPDATGVASGILQALDPSCANHTSAMNNSRLARQLFSVQAGAEAYATQWRLASARHHSG
jgi:glycosyltransferase involved in cell wall biosynthesis